jgi:hypothetical protein
VLHIPVLGAEIWGIDFPGKRIIEQDMAMPYYWYPPTVVFE